MKQQEIPADTDILLSIGGDGTLLNTITLVRDSGIPILGINTGTLGFYLVYQQIRLIVL